MKEDGARELNVTVHASKCMIVAIITRNYYYITRNRKPVALSGKSESSKTTNPSHNEPTVKVNIRALDCSC